MTTLQEHIGGNVKALRGNTSPRELGAALGLWLDKPWTRQAVWDAENGKRVFTAAELLALAAVLDVTLPQLFECTDNVHLPSGKTMPPGVIEALVSGTNNERDRTLRLLASAQALKRARFDLVTFMAGLEEETVEIGRIARGAPQRVAVAKGDTPGPWVGERLGLSVSEGWRAAPPKVPDPAVMKLIFETGERDE